MQIYYLRHSAVAVVLDKSLLVFDCFLCANEGLERGSVSERDLKNAKSVYAFASHSHSDHFNKCIFGWEKINPQTAYILDSTIRDEKMPGKSLPGRTVFLSPGETYEDGYIKAKEFGSTDIGGSFYVECEGVRLFHAGDLNFWHWRDDGDEKYSKQMKILFDRELENIKNGVVKIDYAFFPVDSRIGSGHDEGADLFIEALKPGVFVPIHMNGFGDALAYGEKNFEGTRIIAPKKNGERLV